MKKLFFLIGTILAFFTIENTMQAQNFQISCQRIFTPNEEATIDFYQYGNRRNRKETFSNESIDIALYKVEDTYAFLQSMVKNQRQSIADDVLKELPLLRSWEATINKGKNGYRREAIKLGKLEEGIYVVEVINGGALTSSVPVFISQYGVLNRTVGNDLIAYAHDLQTGKSESDFEFNAILGENIVKPQGKDNNLACFDFTEYKDITSHFPIFARRGKSIAVSKAFVGRNYYSQDNAIKSYTFSDRSAYRPGQTVNFKGIFRQKSGFELNPLQGDMICTITDAQHKEIYKQEFSLDENGTVTGELVLSEDASLGNYRINISPKITDQSPQHRRYNYRGQQYTFRVEEYKKPEYEVNIELDKQQYVNGDEIVADISAQYFFGSPVANAEVEYQVMRQEYYVPWYSHYRCGWWYSTYYNNRGQQEVIESETATIGEDGKLTVRFQTDRKDETNYRYTIQANIRDASRRNILGSSSVIVANTLFNLTAHSEKYYYYPDEKIKIQVSAADFAQNPVQTKVKAKLIEGWRYSRKNRKKDDGKDDRKVIQTETAHTDKDGQVVVEFTPPKKSAHYRIEIEATDDNGKTTRTSTRAYVLSKEDQRYNWWQQNKGDIQIMTDKKVYDAGEQVKAMVYVPQETDVLITVSNEKLGQYDLYRFENDGNDGSKENGQDESENEKGSFKEIIFNIDKNAYGQMDIFVGYVYKNRLRQSTERITIIPQEKYLNVAIEFDETQYKPRETATAIVKVTDDNGNPIPNANVTLSTADESIFFLYPDKTKDIRQAFYDNQRYNAQNYHNSFSSNSQGQYFTPQGILWRTNERNIKLNRNAYLDTNEWIRVSFAQGEDSTKCTINGFVVDFETGNPISNAQIEANGKTFKTDNNGYFEFQSMNSGQIKELIFKTDNNTTTVTKVLLQQGFNVNCNIAMGDKNKEIDGEQFFGKILQGELFETEAFLMGSAGGVAMAEGDMAMDAIAVRGQGAPMERAKMSRMSGQLDAENSAYTMVEATVRNDFQDAIYWNPNVQTNAKGEATVQIKLPDNLTTWRTTAKVITPDTKVGQTIAKTIVRKNLLVRMETPRFMTIGDDLVIATNVHNYLSEAKTVKLQLLANGLELTETEREITVPANGEERIDWKINTKWITNAKLTVKALTNEESDAMELEVPVQPYGLEIVKAESASLKDNDETVLKIEIPKGIDLSTATLEVSVAPSVTSALLASMDQLIGYPYGCVEQTMSRFMPLVVVANTLQELGKDYTTTISKEEMQKMVAQGFKRLKELQHNDGGWGWWKQDASHPYMTAYVINGLYLANKAGYKDDHLYNAALGALKRQFANPQEVEQFGGRKGKNDKQSQDPTTTAYQMMVLMNIGEKELWNTELMPKGQMNPYEQALWLQAATLAGDQQTAQKLLFDLEKSAIKEGTQIYWGGKKFYYNWQDDRVETTANAIKAISMIDPNHPYLANATQWLLRQRKGNAWHNTRQTAITILCLSEIIKQEVNPDMELEIIANGQSISKKKVGRKEVFENALNLDLVGEEFYASADNQNELAELEEITVLKSGENVLEFKQTGKGTHYINAKLTYFDENSQANTTQLFTVERTYYKLNEKKTAKEGIVFEKEKINPQNIQSGDDILVKVKVKSDNEQEYILIKDPIPAGCEFIRDTKSYNISDENLFEKNRRGYGYRWGYWYAHREYRDDHLALTVTKLPKGDYEYTYLMKAQIPGTYQVNPTVVELMYYPENRGYSDFQAVTIKE